MSDRAVPTIRPALVRAARYRLLALVVTPPPPGWTASLLDLAREANVPEALLHALPEITDERAAAEHFHLFTPAGPVSLLASDHLETGFAGKGPVLGDIAGFYEAFGYRPDLKEPPDHFASLFGFLTLLALREASCAHEGEKEQAEVAVEAEREFLLTHVGARFHAFVEKVEAVTDPASVHRSLLDLARSVLDERYGVRPKTPL